MIVLDASAVVELVAGGALAETLRRELSQRREPVIVPHLLDVEVVSALRGLAAGKRIEGRQIRQMLRDLADLPVERHAHAPLFDRVWELRNNFTAYDAIYIALAEAMDAVLITLDRKLEKGHRARVVVICAN
jgi:predicted nucleic acid-binding protein